MSDETCCVKCGTGFYIDPELEATDYCDLCCQQIVHLLAIETPKPPAVITYEQGVEILNLIQRELYSPTKP